MKKSAENSVKVLLKDTILALCRNTLAYRSKVSVEGLIGVTLDDDEIILVSINDMIRGDDAKDKEDSSDSSDSESDGGGSAKKKKRRRRKRSGSKDGQDGAPTPKKSDIKIKGEENEEDVMVIIKEETPEENPDLEWMKNMDSSFHQQQQQQHQDPSANVYGNFPNLQSTMGAAAYPGTSTMGSQQAVTTQGQGPGQQQQGPGYIPADDLLLDFPASSRVCCHLCGAIFVSKDPLDQHIIKCADKKEICSYCRKRYKDVRDLRRHLKTVHGVE